MKILFRVDASLAIGTGHVMRCLTLGRALRLAGHRCLFISREHVGNLNSLIEAEGFDVCRIPVASSYDQDLFHSHWLGASQACDAEMCREAIIKFNPDWIVVDHYALDEKWERAVTPSSCHVLVIDDLADRKHQCHLLLDQNLGKLPDHYLSLVPRECSVITGPQNALLRPEFSMLREKSLARRSHGILKNVLITLGGVDAHNHSGSLLSALAQCSLPEDIHFTVVLGAAAPHFDSLRNDADKYPWPVMVLRGISDMADRMVEADLAIGAGGGTSWERCCLGLPTLLLVVAENQKFASNELLKSGAVELLTDDSSFELQIQSAFESMRQPSRLLELSRAAREVCNGEGVNKIINILERY